MVPNCFLLVSLLTVVVVPYELLLRLVVALSLVVVAKFNPQLAPTLLILLLLRCNCHAIPTSAPLLTTPTCPKQPSTCLHMGNVQRTNRENKGLISADRNNKATLLLTIPRSIQVVCRGFILSNILYCYSKANYITLPFVMDPFFYDARTKSSILNHLTWRG